MEPPQGESTRLVFPTMDMMWGDEIAAAQLTDWRKLAQGLHARFLVDGMSTGARCIAAVAQAGDELGHHPVISLRTDVVDLKLTSDHAVYRDGDGAEHLVEWVTQKDVDLARRVSEIAAGQGSPSDEIRDARDGFQTCGSARAWTRRRPNASTSRSTSHLRWSTSVWLEGWLPEVSSTMTGTRRP